MARIKETSAKPRNDAYTGLLAISFLALVGATVLMALDVKELGTAPEPITIDVPGAKLGKQTTPLQRPTPGGGPAPAPAPAPGM
ncbi:MAG: hypothetical protein R3B84_21715 [Zavarzinella sp.]